MKTEGKNKKTVFLFINGNFEKNFIEFSKFFRFFYYLNFR
jgi:hypothetical protein